MLQAIIGKKIIDSIIKKVMDKRELKKIQNHEKRIKLLEKDSHPPQGCEIAKTKSKKRRK